VDVRTPSIDEGVSKEESTGIDLLPIEHSKHNNEWQQEKDIAAASRLSQPSAPKSERTKFMEAQESRGKSAGGK
jgi:hypothetical protein